MNILLDEIAQSLGLRRSDSQTKPAEIEVQLVDIQGRMADFEHRLVRMEAAFNEFVVAFQRKLSDLARRGAQARQLLASARAKRTRISNVIALKAANDG
jgi:hypothetical protein